MINGTLYIIIVSQIRQFTLVFYHHYKMEGRRQTRMASGVEEKEREKKANELNLPVNRCPLLFPFCSSPSKRASGYASLSCFLSSCSSREATLINEQYAGCFFEMPFSRRRLFSRLISTRSCRFNLSALSQTSNCAKRFVAIFLRVDTQDLFTQLIICPDNEP